VGIKDRRSKADGVADPVTLTAVASEDGMSQRIKRHHAKFWRFDQVAGLEVLTKVVEES
jgi:hypothetical protein